MQKEIHTIDNLVPLSIDTKCDLSERYKHTLLSTEIVLVGINSEFKMKVPYAHHFDIYKRFRVTIEEYDLPQDALLKASTAVSHGDNKLALKLAQDAVEQLKAKTWYR